MFPQSIVALRWPWATTSRKPQRRKIISELVSPSLNMTELGVPIKRVAFFLMVSTADSGRFGNVLMSAVLNFSSSEAKSCWRPIDMARLLSAESAVVTKVESGVETKAEGKVRVGSTALEGDDI